MQLTVEPAVGLTLEVDEGEVEGAGVSTYIMTGPSDVWQKLENACRSKSTKKDAVLMVRGGDLERLPWPPALSAAAAVIALPWMLPAASVEAAAVRLRPPTTGAPLAAATELRPTAADENTPPSMRGVSCVRHLWCT